MKLFQTNNTEIVRACQENFRFELPSVLLKKGKEKLKIKLHNVKRFSITLNKMVSTVNIMHMYYNACLVVKLI